MARWTRQVTMPVMDSQTPPDPVAGIFRRSMWRTAWIPAVGLVVAGGIVATVVALKHGGNEQSAPKVAVAAATPSNTWTPMTFAPDSASADTNGQQACAQLSALIADDSKALAQDDLQPVIDAGSKSSNAGVALQALKLADAWDAAKKAGPSDLAANVNVVTAGIKLETACTEAGLDS